MTIYSLDILFFQFWTSPLSYGLPRWHSNKESSYKAGEAGDKSSIPELERSSGKENGNPLQYSCLENPMDRRAFQATVHGVSKSRTWLKWRSTRTHILLLGQDLDLFLPKRDIALQPDGGHQGTQQGDLSDPLTFFFTYSVSDGARTDSGNTHHSPFESATTLLKGNIYN